MVTSVIQALGRLWQGSEFKAWPGLHSKVFSLSIDQSRSKQASKGLRAPDSCASSNLLREWFADSSPLSGMEVQGLLVAAPTLASSQWLVR